MRKIIFVVFLFFACSNPDNHGDLSIFKTPTTDQFDKWSNIDSVYKSPIKEMVDVYKKSGKLNFNGNPWDNKKFQSKYSDLNAHIFHKNLFDGEPVLPIWNPFKT